MTTSAASLAEASPNFWFLAAYSKTTIGAITRAERYVFSDPPLCLAMLRTFAEKLAQQTRARLGLPAVEGETQFELVARLVEAEALTPEIQSIFDCIRSSGNPAVHHLRGSKQKALTRLQLAHRLAAWFHQTFENNEPSVAPRPFVPPPATDEEPESLQRRIAELTKKLARAEAKIAELAGGAVGIAAPSLIDGLLGAFGSGKSSQRKRLRNRLKVEYESFHSAYDGASLEWDETHDESSWLEDLTRQEQIAQRQTEQTSTLLRRARRCGENLPFDQVESRELRGESWTTRISHSVRDATFGTHVAQMDR